MTLFSLEYHADWGLIVTLGSVDIVLWPHERLHFWGRGESVYYDGEWHCFGLGPIAYISWGPT